MTSKIISFCSRLKRLTNRKITVRRAPILSCVRACNVVAIIRLPSTVNCCWFHDEWKFWESEREKRRRTICWISQHNRLINATQSQSLETCITLTVELLHGKAHRIVSMTIVMCHKTVIFAPGCVLCVCFIHLQFTCFPLPWGHLSMEKIEISSTWMNAGWVRVPISATRQQLNRHNRAQAFTRQSSASQPASRLQVWTDI